MRCPSFRSALLARSNAPTSTSAHSSLAVTGDNRGHHFADVAAELLQDAALAERLGAAGAALVSEALAPPMVQVRSRQVFEHGLGGG